ncbi:MAG: acyl-ACP desaturase [Leptospirillia bacterium]
MRLPLSVLRHHVSTYNELADDANWNRFKSLPWKDLNPDLLTEGQKQAVVFVTHVEDYTPGYCAEYQSIFPVNAPSSQEAMHNRELFHFVSRWGLEEDRHAQALALYQVHSGIEADWDRLSETLILESQKEYQVGYKNLLQVTTYAFLQEKATQLYYQSLARNVQEPVLVSLLHLLTKDESRHFVFFSRIVSSYFDVFGLDCLPLVEEVAMNYRMPLHNTMSDYRRRAIRMAREAPGYDRALPIRNLFHFLGETGARRPEWAPEIEASIARMKDHLRL